MSALDKFVHHISSFSPQIHTHATQSWNGISMTQNEPEIVKEYLLKPGVGVDYLNNNLAPVLSGTTYEVKFASVFIHQKPTVTRTAASQTAHPSVNKRCELGDMLVVFCLIDVRKNPLYASAVILQAKKKDHMPAGAQQYLYDHDFDFNMPANLYNRSVFRSPLRLLPDYPNDRTKALHYLILDTSPFTRTIPWTTSIKHGWDDFLLRVLIGSLGRRFGPIGPPTAPNWGCIIHDLINVGSSLLPNGARRGTSLRGIINLFNDFTDYHEYAKVVDGEENQGLPTLYIIVRDKEEQPQH